MINFKSVDQLQVVNLVPFLEHHMQLYSQSLEPPVNFDFTKYSNEIAQTLKSGPSGRKISPRQNTRNDRLQLIKVSNKNLDLLSSIKERFEVEREKQPYNIDYEVQAQLQKKQISFNQNLMRLHSQKELVDLQQIDSKVEEPMAMENKEKG